LSISLIIEISPKEAIQLSFQDIKNLLLTTRMNFLQKKIKRNKGKGVTRGGQKETPLQPCSLIHW